MEVLILIIPLALLIAIGFIASFVYAVKKGQMDDLDTPSFRMLIDDEKKIQSKVRLKK